MAEEAPWKKKYQKKKKQKPQEKKKNQTNAVKPVNNNYNIYNNIHKTSKKKSGSDRKSFLWIFFSYITFFLLGIGFIYIVDFEKFVRIRDGAGYYVNQTVSLLPPEMVTKGKEAIDYFRPFADSTLTKINIFKNETSTFLNTNPFVKEHWIVLREISTICSARLVDYMQTLYQQTTGFVMSLKKNYFTKVLS